METTVGNVDANVSVGVNTDVNPDELLVKMNNENAVLMIPVIVYMSLLMVVGILGNVMVCYYYGYKTRQTSNSFFIVILAVFDLVTCILSIPIEIVDLRYMYMFENAGACKVLRFINHFASNCSALTLLAISIDRHRRICLPFKKQLNIREAKIACAIAIFVALMFAWPALIFYTAAEVDINNDYGIALIGSDCTTTRESSYRTYLWIFNGMYLFMFIASVLILIVMYSLVGRVLYRHKRSRQRYTMRGVSVNSSSGGNDVIDSSGGDTTVAEDKSIVRSSVIVTSKTDMFSTVDNKKPRTASSTSAANLDLKTVRYTTIMLAITIVFIISFLPYLVLVVWRALVGEYEVNIMTNFQLVMFQIGLRSYFLNSAINPVMYGFFNSKFRTFFYQTLCPCCSRQSGEPSTSSTS